MKHWHPKPNGNEVREGKSITLCEGEQVPWTLLALAVANRKGTPHDFLPCGVLRAWGIPHVTVALSADWSRPSNGGDPLPCFDEATAERLLSRVVGDVLEWQGERWIVVTDGGSHHGRRTLIPAEYIARDL